MIENQWLRECRPQCHSTWCSRSAVSSVSWQLTTLSWIASFETTLLSDWSPMCPWSCGRKSQRRAGSLLSESQGALTQRLNGQSKVQHCERWWSRTKEKRIHGLTADHWRFDALCSNPVIHAGSFLYWSSASVFGWPRNWWQMEWKHWLSRFGSAEDWITDHWLLVLHCNFPFVSFVSKS